MITVISFADNPVVEHSLPYQRNKGKQDYISGLSKIQGVTHAVYMLTFHIICNDEDVLG